MDHTCVRWKENFWWESDFLLGQMTNLWTSGATITMFGGKFVVAATEHGWVSIEGAETGIFG